MFGRDRDWGWSGCRVSFRLSARNTAAPPPLSYRCGLQAIYGFKGSDARYLSAAHNVWPGAGERPWVSLHLRTSYRITGPMATFVNEVRGGCAGPPRGAVSSHTT
jgi:hypothetical protein